MTIHNHTELPDIDPDEDGTVSVEVVALLSDGSLTIAGYDYSAQEWYDINGNTFSDPAMQWCYSPFKSRS